MEKKIKRIAFLLIAVLSFGFSIKAQTITLTLNSEVTNQVSRETERLNVLREEICSVVDQMTQDVTVASDGSPNYPNWVVFYELAHSIDSLNGIWNEAYGTSLEEIISVAISSGATNATDDEYSQDLLADIIEEDHLTFEQDIASVCFETKFNFVSLRKCLEDADVEWLENSASENFDFSQSPIANEDLDEDEFWTLMTCDKKFNILNTTIDDDIVTGMESFKLKDLIATIKEIVEVLGGIVDIAEQLHELFADCAGTTTVRENMKKAEIDIDGSHWIGYKMMQKGQTIDFANKTITKIKGKAYLYKAKASGKRKRDRKGTASIGFCAKEQNNCEGIDWPSDPGPYVAPHRNGKKGGRVKLPHREPKALAIDKTYHFLQFKFGKNGVFVEARNLLGNTGCTHASNTKW